MNTIICGLAQTKSKEIFGDFTAGTLSSKAIEQVKAANLEHHLNLIAAAKSQGVEVLCLGELFQFPYFPLTKSPIWFEFAEILQESSAIEALTRAAKENGIAIIAPIFEKDPHVGKFFNTAVVIDDVGQILGTYRKCHIPQGSNEIAAFNEGFYFSPCHSRLNKTNSNKLPSQSLFPVFTLNNVKFGIMICFDRHFPETFRILKENGAQVIFCPSVTFGTVSQRVWAMEFEVEAVRNNVFIGALNRKGKAQFMKTEFFGNSFFCGPNGQLKDTSTNDELIVSEITPTTLHADPAGWQIHAHRNQRLYTEE